MARAPELTAEEFFKIPQPHSILKAEIVSKYVIGWANIIIRYNIHSGKDARAYVVDLFSGAGAYDEGTKSTPLKIVDAAAASTHLRDNLILRFNDESREMISRLQKNVENIYPSSTFKYPIKFTSLDADSQEVASWFLKNGQGPKLPMLVFIDPFGYKQISQDLLRSIIRIPQSDILFFFNYKRVNAALGNESFESNMNKMFGDIRVKRIKDELTTAYSSERPDIIIRHLEEALKEIGANYVASYVVVPEDEDQISHYIVGVTKHPKGYELFKKVMKQHSKIGLSAKSKFGHDLASVERDKQQSLFDHLPDPIGDLAMQLKSKYAGQVVKFGQLYNAHHPTGHYTESEYKQAIRRLIVDKEVCISAEVSQRKNSKGELAVPDHLIIKFS